LGVRNCNTRDAIEWSKRWLARGGGQPRAPAPKAGDGDDGARRIEWALAIWDEAVSPRRTVVETYLRRRALVLTDALADEVIRYHRKCPWQDAAADKTIFAPAMVVAMRSIATDKITAIQRTRLSQDGKKIERRMLGIASGAAVKLDDAATVTNRLHIAEGVETAMTARQIRLRPTWALGSATAIAAFPVLDDIERLTILAEHDEANERATAACGGRWQVVMIPSDVWEGTEMCRISRLVNRRASRPRAELFDPLSSACLGLLRGAPWPSINEVVGDRFDRRKMRLDVHPLVAQLFG